MRVKENVIEELQALIDSPGWRIFRELVLEMYGDARVLHELNGQAQSSPDLNRLGMQTAVVLSTRKALDNILALPGAWIEQAEQERKAEKRGK